MKPIDEISFENLSTEELASRMDGILLGAMKEDWGFTDTQFQEVLMSPGSPARIHDVVETEKFKAAADPKRRRLLDASFRYLMQLSLWEASFLVSNQLEDNAEWHSPLFQLKAYSLHQYQIISARIALECFFDLIAIANDGNRLKGDRKFKAFKKWMLKEDSPYRQFIPVVVAGFRFSRQFRDPEVHGTSMFKEPFLRLAHPSRELGWARVDLTNALRTAWKPLMVIMNGHQPEGFWTLLDLDFHQHYVTIENSDFDSYLKSFFDKQMS